MLLFSNALREFPAGSQVPFKIQLTRKLSLEHLDFFSAQPGSYTKINRPIYPNSNKSGAAAPFEGVKRVWEGEKYEKGVRERARHWVQRLEQLISVRTWEAPE